MTFQELRDLAAVAQSLMIALAALIGGGWALFRFFSLRSVEKARLDLEQAQRALRERATLQVSLHAEQIASPIGRFISVQASLTNVGNFTEVIEWSTSALTATRVASVAGGNLVFSKEENHGQRLGLINTSTIVPTEITRHSFLVPVPEAGTYYLLFQVTCSRTATSILKRERSGTGVVAQGTETWSEDLFFNVTDTPA